MATNKKTAPKSAPKKKDECKGWTKAECQAARKAGLCK